MKLVIQRTKNASVSIDGNLISKIEFGLVIFICLEVSDSEPVIERAVSKILRMRLFENSDTGKMDKNIIQVEGQILAISQFTLAWDGSGGHRPSYDQAMPGQSASILFKLLCDRLKKSADVQTGQFGADMLVTLENDGPVTFAIDID